LDGKIIGEILKDYDIHDPSIAFIRHNENMTYKVTDDANGMAYLLRIHKAVISNMSGVQHTYEGLNAEMSLLQQLQERMDLDVRVPTPVRNIKGEWVTFVTDDGKVVHCTLLNWIEGKDMQQNETIPKEHIIHFGEQVGNLHQFSRSAGMGMSHVRPAYAGIAQNELMLKRLKLGVSMGIFSTEDINTLNYYFESLNSSLENYSMTGSTWGIIHADINKGNLLVSEQGLALIDFCLFGFGYYLYDVGGSILSLKADERDYFITGYTSKAGAISVEDMRRLEGFMMLSILGYYAFHLENEDRHSWMRERMPIFCKTYCLPYLNNQSIFYTF